MANPVWFIRMWFASILALAALVIGLNVVIDPYEVFGSPRIAGINLLKPSAKNHAMLAKTYQVARVRPATVLIGSSVVHIGIDAFDPAWPVEMRPVYNYGIPGGYATSSGLLTLQEAWVAGNLKTVVVFLDFQNFFDPEREATSLSEDDRRFHLLSGGGSNPYRTEQVAKDMFLASATMGAFVDSMTTVVRQNDPSLLNLARDGSSTEADFINAARSDGIYDLFAQKEAFEAERAASLRRTLHDWKGPLPNLGKVAAFITFAEAHNLRLILVVGPHHSDGMELYWREGLWPRVEQLKTELAALTAPHAGTVTLWDFMDYSAFNTEAIPSSGDRVTSTKWFWESTHFKKQLGTIMINTITGAVSPVSRVPEFGAVLTPDNVQIRNENVRAQRWALLCDGRLEILTKRQVPADGDCPRAQAVAKQR